MGELSGIAYINITDNTSPFDIVNDWFADSQTNGISKIVFNLATSKKSGEVSNRTLVLSDFVSNKFRFVSNERTLKGRDMSDNPKVAACFLLNYLRGGNQRISRQIRCQGEVSKLPYEETAKYYQKDPTFAQIRSHICMQGEKVDWNEQKRKYDELLKKVQNGLKLEMPDYQIGYEISPYAFDFYESSSDQIADRIIFKKSADCSWSFYRVAA